MIITVEDVSACRKKILVTIPQEKVKDEFKEAYKARGKTAKLKGFRTGKVPLNVLKKFYKKDIEEKVLYKLIGESCKKAFEEHSINCIGDVEIDSKEKLQILENEELTFAILVNTRPEIDSLGYEGLKLSSESKKVEEKEIDAIIEQLQNKFSTLEEVTDRPAIAGDVLKVSYGCKNGETDIPSLAKSDTYAIARDDDSPNNLENFPPIFKGVLGMSDGEKKEIQAVVPEGFQTPELVGATLSFDIEVHEIKKRVLPELNDAFAEKFSKDNMESLREEIKKDLDNRCEAEFRNALIKEAEEVLISSNPMKYPEHMVEEEILAWKKEKEKEKLKEEKGEEEYNKLVDEFRKTLTDDFKLNVITSEIAKVEKVSISESEVRKRIELIFHYTNRKDLHNTMKNKDYVENIRWGMLKERVMDIVLEKSEQVGAKDANSNCC